jgi:nucleotide-binding universal stress UspA family protein
MTSRESVVVVGVDGSPGSLAALLHGFHEAVVLGGSVEVVTAWRRTAASGAEEEQMLGALGRRWALRAQSGVVAHATRFAVQVPPLTSVIVEGDPARALARAGEGAACIVLGKSDPLTTASESVRERCMALATCPVVVVPDVDAAGIVAAQGQPLLLGVVGATEGGGDVRG